MPSGSRPRPPPGARSADASTAQGSSAVGALPITLTVMVAGSRAVAKAADVIIFTSPMPDTLYVRPGLSLPLGEIELRTSRSSGPGGQHANVTASRVEAVFDVAASEALSEAQKARITSPARPAGDRVGAGHALAAAQPRARARAAGGAARARAGGPPPADGDQADEGEPPAPAGREEAARRREARPPLAAS